MSEFEKTVLRICLYKPQQMIPMLKKLGNTGHVYCILEKWFGERIGIEFETGYHDPVVSKCNPNYGCELSCPEIRYSSSGFKNLVQLFILLEDMKNQISFNLDSGIHIHVNYPRIHRLRYIPEISYIFEYLKEKFEYTGFYNEPKVSKHKTSMIRLHPHNSIEYRFFSMTFDYHKLVKWILCCVYMTRNIKTGNIDTSIIDEIMAL